MNETPKTTTENPCPKCSAIKISMNSMRIAILDQIKKGQREMDLESFLMLVHEVYLSDKD